jgi:hypothetical protein
VEEFMGGVVVVSSVVAGLWGGQANVKFKDASVAFRTTSVK